jgi:hypothetical protein
MLKQYMPTILEICKTYPPKMNPTTHPIIFFLRANGGGGEEERLPN